MDREAAIKELMDAGFSLLQATHKVNVQQMQKMTLEEGARFIASQEMYNKYCAWCEQPIKKGDRASGFCDPCCKSCAVKLKKPKNGS